MWLSFERDRRVYETHFPSGLLHIPEQKDTALSGFDARPRHIDQWVKTLPRADIGEMARLVYKGLHELNRVKIPDADRLRIVEMFREPVNYLSMSLKKHYIGLPFPLARKKQKVALLSRELHSEMAIGYKILIESKIAEVGLRIDNRQMAQVIHRAIHYLSQVLLRCYQIYIPPPHNVWKEIHQLYLYAQEKNLQDLIVKSQIGDQIADSSITSLYKRVVLLSLAGPYRLRQSEIESLYTMLAEWETLVQISEVVDPEQQTGMCSLNLNSDEPPGYLTLCSDLNISYCRVLDTTSLVEGVGHNIAAGLAVQIPGALGKTNRLNVELLRRLVLTWGGMARRNFSRASKDSKVLVAVGLSAMHYFIHDALQQEAVENIARVETKPAENKKPAVPPPAAALNLDLLPLDHGQDHGAVGKHIGAKSRFDGKPLYSVANPDTRKKDAWNPLLKLDTPAYDPAPGATPGPEVTTKPGYDFHICTTVNESAGGFCLVWMPVEGSDTRSLNALVGELIGMQEIDESNKSRWSVGVVRWMKSRDGKQLELGVQKLAPYAVAATVRMEKGRKQADAQRALVLPEIKNANQPITLIAPNMYEVGDTLALDIGTDKKSVRLIKILDSTGAFSHFQYKELKKPERPREPTGDDDSKWNFDNLWSSL